MFFISRTYVTVLVFLDYHFLTLLHFFTFLISFYSFYTFLLNHLLQVNYNHSSVVHSDLKNHNVFFKNIKCKLNL